MAERIAWLVPLIPWLAAAWIGFGRLTGTNVGEAGEPKTARSAVGAIGLSLLLLLGLDGIALVEGAPGYVRFAPWLESGSYRVNIDFLLDGLALAVATLIALVAFLVTRFSVTYMHREAGFQRFFAILSLFSGAMLLIVTAGNVVLAFVGWELAGLSSYLLIGYAFDRNTATANATRAFITNRFGDAGFVFGIALSFLWLHSIEWPDIRNAAASLGTLNSGVVAAGFVLAALAKSAQMPFSAWLARALEGPTPSSAVFYGSLMVHAGVFLILRVEPLILQAPLLGIALAGLGALTAIHGILAGLTQSDVKSALVFSVQAQVGLMFLECGLGWFDLAAWHMALHAGFRIYQFLSAPGYMHLAGGVTRPVPAWLAARGHLYTAALGRFWIDPLSEILVVRPTLSLARDVQAFDQGLVDRMVGRPDTVGMVTSLAEWEEQRLGQGADDTEVGHARGLLGRTLERLAAWLHWFEERLVLSSGGEGLLRLIRRLGKPLMQVDGLLSQPRYLILLIALTFVIIL